MNIIILEPDEVGVRIPRSDRRWRHVRDVLRKGRGSALAAGVADGMLGTATVLELDDAGMVLDFRPERACEPLAPLRLVLGFPRPIQAARILRDLASLGVGRIDLTGTELGEKSYTQSDFFKKRDFRAHLVEGAEQAGNALLPEVATHWSLARCLDALRDSGELLGPRAATSGHGSVESDRGEVLSGTSRGSRCFLHPYGEAPDLGALEGLEAPAVLAVGSERGWTEAEAGALLDAGFFPVRIGKRILRTETAALAAVVLALSKLHLL